MKTIFSMLALLFAGIGWEDAVLYLSGASSIEELSQTEMERFENLREHPLDLNSAPRGKLLASGLFSPYQIAAINEYVSRHGDILSFSELALVDGIPVELADALKLFITLKSRSRPGERNRDAGLSGEVTGRVSIKASGDGNPSWNYGVKSRFDLGERFELCAGNKSFSASYFGKRHIGKIVVGDYNARFGQGMVLWSGFSLSGFHSPESFYRNGNGISPCCSFSADHNRGIAAELLFGACSVNLVASHKGQFGGNVAWVGKSVSAGATFSAELEGKGSLGSDFRFTAGKFTVFGEAVASFDRKNGRRVTPVGVLGLNLNLAYRHRLSAAAKYDGKWTNALGYQWKWLFASLEYDIASKGNDLKLFAEASHKFSVGNMELTPSLRWQEKLSYTQSSLSLRSEVRSDVTMQWAEWKISTRLDVVRCSNWAFMTYLEGGYVKDSFELWFRPCLFLVDNWSDRIYCYERDAPGAFNVAAFNGRGFRVSAYSALKLRTSGKRKPDAPEEHPVARTRHLRISHKLYFRVCYTSPHSGKAPSCEAKLQYSLSF